MSELKPYFVKEKGAEWSLLSFHYGRHKAKVQASKNWPTRFEYIDLRVTRANDDYMIFSKSDKPHVVDSYPGDYPTWELALQSQTEGNDVTKPNHTCTLTKTWKDYTATSHVEVGNNSFKPENRRD